MSTNEQQDESAQVDLSRLPVGDHLRSRREELGWTLPDVAAWLRIRLAYLEALENGEVAKLPGNAYALGFLRAYSGMLGLDSEDMARRFRNETKDVNRKPELSFPAPVPERGVPAGAIVLLGVVVVIGAYVGWYEFTGRSQREAHTVPAVPAALLPYAGGTASGAAGPSPQVATVMPGPGQTPSEMPAGPAVSTTTSPPVAAVAAQPNATTAAVPDRVASTPPVPVQTPAATPAQTVTTAPPGTTAPGTTPAIVSGAPVGPGPAGITLNAVGSSWVQVRQPGGKVLYDHVLKAGDSWNLPADSGDVTLSTGNAGGLTLSADGVTTPVLGRVGAVRRGVPLTVAAIKDGSIVNAVPGPAVAKDPAVVSAPVGAPPARRPAAHPAPVVEPEDATDRLNQRQLTTPQH